MDSIGEYHDWWSYSHLVQGKITQEVVVVILISLLSFFCTIVSILEVLVIKGRLKRSSNLYFCYIIYFIIIWKCDNENLNWQTTFDTPKGDDPIALDLSSMAKGEAWVNGQSIGRYWILFLDSKGNPSQSLWVTTYFYLIL